MLDRCAAVIASHAAFPFRLDAVGRFPATAYLEPTPAAPFVALTHALWAAFPAFPPFRGEFASVVPHLTVGHGNEAIAPRVAALLLERIAKQGAVTSVCRSLSLIENSSGRWRRLQDFQLQPTIADPASRKGIAVHLDGSCHCGKVRFAVESAEPVPFMRCYCSICRKTAGAGGYAINLGAVTRSMRVTGKRYLRIYRARIANDRGRGTHLSSARRYFCSQCGSALWAWDPTWPELVHPHASAIDTPLPQAPDNVHCMVGSKAPWVKVEGDPNDPRFDAYPSMSLAQWHHRKHLDSPASDASDPAKTSK